MGINFTEEQLQVIQLRDRNILVSAAAGSGKTAVLVERIIARLTRDEQPIGHAFCGCYHLKHITLPRFTNASHPRFTLPI